MVPVWGGLEWRFQSEISVLHGHWLNLKQASGAWNAGVGVVTGDV